MPLPQDHWLNKAEIDVFARLPWNQQAGITNQVQTDALGLFQEGVGIKRWAPVKVYGLTKGGVVVQAQDNCLVLDKQGKVTGRFSLPGKRVDGLIDLENGGYLVLAHDPAVGKELVQIKSQEVSLIIPSEKDLVQLLRSGAKAMGIYKENDHFSVVDLGLDGEDHNDQGPTDAQVNPVFIDSNGGVQFLSYNPQLKARLWNTQLPSGEITPVTIPRELYGNFSKPHAIDQHGSAYGLFGASLGKLGADGQEVWKIELESLIPSEDGGWYLSRFVQDSSTVKVYFSGTEGSGIFCELKIPATVQSKYHNPLWKLVSVESEMVTLLGRDPRSYSYHQLQFNSKTGEMTEQTPPTDLSRTGSFLQGGNAWVVTPNGDVIVPIATPDALVLAHIRM